MKTIHVCMAEDAGPAPVEPATIVIGERSDTNGAARCALYAADAAAIADVLQSTLPGGTFDRLLVILLEGHASALRVSHRSLETTGAAP